MFLYEPLPIDSPHIIKDGYVGINQYLEYGEGTKSTYGYEWYVEGTENDPDKFGTTLMYRKTPTYYQDAWEVNLKSSEVNWLTGFPTLTFELKNNHRTYYRYSDGPMKHFGESARLNLNVGGLNYSYTTNKLESFETEEISFDIPIDITRNNANITWDLTAINEYEDQYTAPFTSTGKINLLKYWNNHYDIDLSEGTQIIFNPIGFSGKHSHFERIDFIPTVGQTKFPTNITNLYKIVYSNDLNENIPLIETTTDAMLKNMWGVEDMFHSQRYKNGKVFLNDKYFYDHNEKITKKGNSNDFEVSYSFKTPWDYSNNFGEMTSKIEITTFSKRTYNVKSYFGNKQRLRGDDNSKYYFKFVNLNKNLTRLTLTLTDISSGIITAQELEDLLNYEI